MQTTHCAPATPSQVAEHKGVDWENEEPPAGEGLRLCTSKEPEGAQVHSTWWDASTCPEGTGGWSV